MKTRRARVVQRLGVIAAATVVVGSYFTGMAFAADGDGGSSTPSTSSGSGGNSLVKTLEDAGVPNANAATDPITDITDITDSSSATATTSATTCNGIPLGPICIPTNIPTGGSSTSATAPSGANTVMQYSPYPSPVFGDYGHRYYGKYYDRGCGCDRFAAPTYAPQTVVATQVASVPKGGVDTGDGSFQ